MIEISVVEGWQDRLYVAAEGASLRREDRRKALEVQALLEEVERTLRKSSQHQPITLLDAAAGKSYLGLLAAKLVLEPLGRQAKVITLEREPERVRASRLACSRLESSVAIECRQNSVADRAAWPEHPTLVVALHACGAAADDILDGAIGQGAQWLLLVPCCTSRAVRAARWAEQQAEAWGIPRHAPVRRRFVQALVDSDRTLRLEAAGYQTEVVEFVAPTVTPHNLLWRARHVGEPGRMARAEKARPHY
jgi:hypothetical protein